MLRRRRTRPRRAGQLVSAVPQTAGVQRVLSAEAALAGGDLVAARRWADDAVSTTTGMFALDPLTTRARVAIAQGEPDQAERDAHDALARAAEVEAYLFIPDILECLGTLAGEAGSHREAARLFGAAEAIRQRMGAVRFKIYDAGYEASVAALRDAMGEHDFESAWAEGAALSTEEAIAYAQRGRGQRKRPTSGWGSLTPTELRRRSTRQRRAGQQRHRHKAFRLTAHRANPPHPRLHQARPDLPRAARPGSSPPRLKVNALSSLAGCPCVNTGIDRLGGDDGERGGQWKAALERLDPGAADDGGQCEGGFQHGEMVADA